MSQEIVVLEHIADSACILQRLKFNLSCLAVIELVMIARFEIDTYD